MPKYNVTIEIDYKSDHTDEIEAKDEAAAEDKAKENFWDDEYEDELRMNRENDDQCFNANEIIEKQTCPICKHTWEKVEEEAEYKRVKEFNDSDKIIHDP